MPVKHSIVLSGFSLNTWIKSNTILLTQELNMKTIEICKSAVKNNIEANKFVPNFKKRKYGLYL